MAKILLVEDDNNLREIYEARLQAEGYEIVSAMDGEEALVVAKKEKPDLVISDVMMPRISGFEMLDILRNTDGLKDVRVIMLTALGQAEDKTRADSLGADRYLVKSQVTLEDIVKAAQELISGEAAPAAMPEPATAAATPAPAAPSTAPVPPAPAPAPEPPVTPVPVATPPAAPAAAPEPATPEPAVPVVEPLQPATAPAPAPSAPVPVVTHPAPPTPEPTPTPPAPAPVTPPAPAPPEPAPSVPVVPPPAPAMEPPAPSPTPEPPAATPAPATAVAEPEPVSTPSAPTVPEPSAPEPAPEKPDEQAVSSEPSMAQSTSEEEATVKAQIEDFVKQNDQTAPAAESAPTAAPEPTAPATGDDMMADAIRGLVSDAQPENSKPAEEKVVAPSATDTRVGSMPTDIVTPTQTETPAAEAPTVEVAKERDDRQSSSNDDGSTVAHKKIIKPITNDSAAPQSDLSELLAKEGLTGDEDDAHPYGNNPPPAPTVNNTPQPAQTPSGLPTTPHPPGHVISPDDQSGVDPNSISL